MQESVKETLSPNMEVLYMNTTWVNGFLKLVPSLIWQLARSKRRTVKCHGRRKQGSLEPGSLVEQKCVAISCVPYLQVLF